MFETFGIQGFLIRWMMAMFLVLATFNPSGYSYYHWIIDRGNRNGRNDRARRSGQSIGRRPVMVLCPRPPVGSGGHQQRHPSVLMVRYDAELLRRNLRHRSGGVY